MLHNEVHIRESYSKEELDTLEEIQKVVAQAYKHGIKSTKPLDTFEEEF